MLSAFNRRFSGCLIASLLTAAGHAGAQSARVPSSSPVPPAGIAALRNATRNDSVSHIPPDSVLKQFVEGPHTTMADRAVVGVEVVNQSRSGATEMRRCSGLLLRCDGFLLVPPAITVLAMSSGEEAAKQTIRATLEPGTPQARIALAYLHHYIVQGVDLTVLKLQDVHAPAARPLLSDGLKPDDEVRIVWTNWEAEAGRFGAVQGKNVRIGTQPKDADEAKKLGWKPGDVFLLEPQEGIPPGATVVGPEGMALGILPGSAKRSDRFVSFSVLERVTNCVAAAQTTDADFAALQKKDKKDEKGTSPADGDAAKLKPEEDPSAQAKTGESKGAKQHLNDLIEIPGGPVKLPALFQRDQQDMCGEVIACVPAFKIDRYKVSNQEYYEFWKAIPQKERARKEVQAALYPVSWAASDPPFPTDLENVPVLGVPLSGAQAYARSQGKRLPTAYEWSRAAFGPFGDALLPAWVQEYIQDRKSAWLRLVTVHNTYMNLLWADAQQKMAISNIDRKARGLSAEAVQPETWLTIPILSPENDFAAGSIRSQKQIADEMARLCAKWRDPLYVLPSGSRPFDESPFGVRDVLLNGNERVIFSPEPQVQTGLQGRRPQAVQMQWNGVAWAGGLGLSLRGPASLAPFPVEVPLPLSPPEFFPQPFYPLLLSRRLVAPSALVHAEQREFSPSDSEAYAEFRARVYEAMMMILPIQQTRVADVWDDTIADDRWGEGTVTVNRPPPRVITPTGILLAGHSFNSRNDYAEYGFTNNLSGDGVQKRLSIVGPTGEMLVVNGPLYRKRNLFGEMIVTSNTNYYYPYTEYLSTQNGTGIRLDEAELLFRGIYFDEAPFYSAWAGPSPFMRREMGRDWAKDPSTHVGAWPELGRTLTQPPSIFLIPNGFRCAR